MLIQWKKTLVSFVFICLEFCEFQASHFASQIVCLFVFFPAFLDLVVAPNLITDGKLFKKILSLFFVTFFFILFETNYIDAVLIHL